MYKGQPENGENEIETNEHMMHYFWYFIAMYKLF
jgi:hypothetical protein